MTDLAVIDQDTVDAALEPTVDRIVYERDLERLADLSYTELVQRLNDPEEARKMPPSTVLKVLAFCEERLGMPALHPAPEHQTNNIFAVIADRGLPVERLRALAEATLAQLPIVDTEVVAGG